MKDLERIEVFSKQLQSIHENMKKSIAIAHIHHEEIQKNFQAIFEFENTLKTAIDRINLQSNQLQFFFEKLPGRTQNALLNIGKLGWYFDMNMPLSSLWTLNDGSINENFDEIEEALKDYFESRTTEIEKTVVESFPKRREFIISAFNAHKRQEYELSVPVFLSQTDGICKEVTNKYLFIKNRSKQPEIADYVEQSITDTLEKAFFSVLTLTLPISQSQKDRSLDFKGLNRHMVLHGESLDYNTQINSLKAISMLNYVVYLLKNDENN